MSEARCRGREKETAMNLLKNTKKNQQVTNTKGTICPNCNRIFFTTKEKHDYHAKNKFTLICDWCKNHNNA